jgi:hypothetical protein
MGVKAEISWKQRSPGGERREVCAQRTAGRWVFHQRTRRFDPWVALPQPALEDWLTLLEAVERRVPRRLHRPEEVQRIRQAIREQFPETTLPGP